VEERQAVFGRGKGKMRRKQYRGTVEAHEPHGAHGHGHGRGRVRGAGPSARAGDDPTCDAHTLDSVRPGEHVEIEHVMDDVTRAQAIRLGLGEGSPVTCVTKLPYGPVILKCGLQEIAVGRGLARRIRIRRDERVSDHGAL
jgi:ferrous iron transport protein A